MSVANTLLTNYQHVISELKLVTGGGGVHDIECDGVVLFSKARAKRQPTDEEVLAAFEELLPEGTLRYGE